MVNITFTKKSDSFCNTSMTEISIEWELYIFGNVNIRIKNKCLKLVINVGRNG